MRRLIVFALLVLGGFATSHAQILFTENFDDAGANTRWRLESSPGSKTNPTPTGIPGLSYNASTGVNNDACNNFWVINNFHTPSGTSGSYTSSRAGCAGVASGNRSLHITYRNKDLCGSNSFTDADYTNSIGYGKAQAEVADGFWWRPVSPASLNSYSDQMAVLTTGFSTLGRCNLVVSFDAFLGGDINLVANTARSVLYSMTMGRPGR